MRNLLFTVIGSMGQNFVDGLKFLLEVVVNVQIFIFDLILNLFTNLFRGILILIDKERVHHADTCLSQDGIFNELTILSQISSVKEDAVNRKTWTPDHSNAMSFLATKLFNECEWEEDKIHSYMKSVVESIPGLTYAIGPDDEEEGIPLDD